MSFSRQEIAHLQDIVRSMQETRFGGVWPSEYVRLYKRWGYFNRVYDVLYNDPQEWMRIARVALDNRFQGLSDRLINGPSLKQLANLPCVGDGRSNYEPKAHIRIAFQTLRQTFDIPLDEVCNKRVCTERQTRGWVPCYIYSWPNPPAKIARPEDAVYTPLGAALAITYQVRNNLFHGSKMQMRRRDIELVALTAEIVKEVLEEIARTFEEGARYAG